MPVSLRPPMLLVAVISSVGAAGIHFAVIEEHLQEYALFGYLFLGLAWFQAAWAMGFLARPSRWLAWVGILVSLGVAAVWAWSRTTGLPVGPEPWEPEVVGPLDVAATALEVVIALSGLALALRWQGRSPTSLPVGPRGGWLVAMVYGAAVIAVTGVAFVAQDALDAMG